MVAIQVGVIQAFNSQRGESLHVITLGSQVRGAPRRGRGLSSVPTSNESLIALRGN